MQIATTRQEIRSCYSVMAELRPHIAERGFVSRVLRQAKEGYRLAFLKEAGTIRAVSGFRIMNTLAWGKYLYVDDLVTRESDRLSGYGERLFGWLVSFAKKRACGELHLDSGVHRTGAHRFYFKNRMVISSYHFSLKLLRGRRRG